MELHTHLESGTEGERTESLPHQGQGPKANAKLDVSPGMRHWWQEGAVRSSHVAGSECREVRLELRGNVERVWGQTGELRSRAGLNLLQSGSCSGFLPSPFLSPPPCQVPQAGASSCLLGTKSPAGFCPEQCDLLPMSNNWAIPK